MTTQEVTMVKKYCESQKQKGYISESNLFKIGYNRALDNIISFLNEIIKDEIEK